MEVEEQTVEQVLSDLRKTIDDISDDKVYYMLREYKFKGIYAATIKMVKTCIGLSSFGLPITPQLINALMPDRTMTTHYGKLHLLGDKHVLLLSRGGSGYKHTRTLLNYIIHPAFQRKIDKYLGTN